MQGELTPQVLGQRMREMIERHRIRQERAAAELDVSLDTFKRYLSGKTDPSAIQVWKLAELCGESVSAFLGDSDVVIPEDLDADIIRRLLDTLEQRNRADGAVINELRGLLEQA